MLSFSETVMEMIDLRSYSSVWFWILLAGVWTGGAQYVLGIPWDIVLRSRHGGRAEADLTDMARVTVNRIVHFAGQGGLALAGIGAAVLTMLALLGFVWLSEFAQGVFFLLAPVYFIASMSVRTAHGIARSGAVGDELRRRLRNHRLIVQLAGAVSIFVTALWGVVWSLQGSPI